MECMAKGETEDLMKKEVISDWFSFQMFLHTSLYGCHDILHLVLKFDALYVWNGQPGGSDHIIYNLESSCEHC